MHAAATLPCSRRTRRHAVVQRCVHQARLHSKHIHAAALSRVQQEFKAGSEGVPPHLQALGHLAGGHHAVQLGGGVLPDVRVPRKLAPAQQMLVKQSAEQIEEKNSMCHSHLMRSASPQVIPLDRAHLLKR